MIKNKMEDFELNGWLGSFPLLNEQEANCLSNLYDSYQSQFVSPTKIGSCSIDEKFIDKPWFKSLHAVIPSFRALASHPAIVSKVCSILGENVILWGTSVEVRQPGQVHRWHVDAEHKRWRGVSVFIGLSGASNLSTLKVISGSHKINFSNKFFRHMPNDKNVLKEAKKYNSNNTIASIDILPGEFFLFDGPLWHGSENKSNETRYAVIAQYATPDSRIEVPLNWDEPIRWANCNPPCILVSGSDSKKLNTLLN